MKSGRMSGNHSSVFGSPVFEFTRSVAETGAFLKRDSQKHRHLKP